MPFLQRQPRGIAFSQSYLYILYTTSELGLEPNKYASSISLVKADITNPFSAPSASTEAN